MRIGIVGSRIYANLQLIGEYISGLPKDTIILTGGCRGVDQEAERQAKLQGLHVIVYAPALSNAHNYIEATQAYYARNQQIVDHCDMLIAYTDNNTGGTWDTIRRAKKKGIPVRVIRSTPAQSALF